MLADGMNVWRSRGRRMYAHVNMSWQIKLLVLAPFCLWLFSLEFLKAYFIIQNLPEGEEPADFLEVAEGCGPSCYP